MRPIPTNEDEENATEDAECGITTLRTMPTISPFPRSAFMARKKGKQDKASRCSPSSCLGPPMAFQELYDTLLDMNANMLE